jgi:hypothetical protein
MGEENRVTQHIVVDAAGHSPYPHYKSARLRMPKVSLVILPSCSARPVRSLRAFFPARSALLCYRAVRYSPPPACMVQ